VTPSFLPGLDLSRRYYAEIVRPLLDQEFPRLPHSAALIGWGSDVLGFDTPRSRDHNWGPRLQLFLGDDQAGHAGRVADMLTARLPAEFLGYPTAFTGTFEETQLPVHWVSVARLRAWLTASLGFDPTGEIGLADWLSVPTQALAEVTTGEVFHDGLARDRSPGLTGVRAALAWYPRDIWLYVLASQWQRIAQEEAFPGRCAEADDELGSAVVIARLARDVMRLALLLQRRYPVYSKWLGTQFARTAAGEELGPHLRAAVTAATWPGRERSMTAAYEAIGRLHNATGLTPPLDTTIRPTYFERPFQVPDAERFARALQEQISDPRLRALPLMGAVDQFMDNTDALASSRLRKAAVSASAAEAIGD